MTGDDQKEYEGRIEIYGKIFLDDFFSMDGGVSDADTVKIFIAPNSIRFRQHKDADWQNGIKALSNAYYYDEVDGRRKKIIITDSKTNKEYIRIRLQGIDAPELHYRANRGDLFLFDDAFSKFTTLNKIFEFRQNWGARAATELAKLLKNKTREDSTNSIDAFAFSSIDTPNNLFDRFGRAVGDVVLSEHDINLNQWLVGKGWAFIDFYDSMSNNEILSLKKESVDASNSQNGIIPSYTKELVRFDFDLLFDKKETKDFIDIDKGPLNMPKFFRKQIDYEILKKRGGYGKDKTLKQFIQSRKSGCYLLDEFLEKRHDAQKHELAEFIDDNGIMNVEPGSLVNIESDSQIETPNIINNWY